MNLNKIKQNRRFWKTLLTKKLPIQHKVRKHRSTPLSNYLSASEGNLFYFIWDRPERTADLTIPCSIARCIFLQETIKIQSRSIYGSQRTPIVNSLITCSQLEAGGNLAQGISAASYSTCVVAFCRRFIRPVGDNYVTVDYVLIVLWISNGG